MWALKNFEYYLYGQVFTLTTDHRPLTWLKTMKNANQRLTRWAVFLQQFKFDIQHRPGSQHKNADKFDIQHRPGSQHKNADGLSRGGRDVTKQAKAAPNSPDNHAVDFIENTIT